MSTQARAYAYALGAVFLWSTVAAAFKQALDHLHPVELLAHSALIAAIVLLGYAAARGGLRSISRSDLRRSAVLGALNPFGYYLVIFHAYDLLLGQEAQVLNYSWGIVLPLLSIPLLGQRIRARSLAALLISFAGVYIVAARGDLAAMRFREPLGVGLAVGSSLIWALYWIFNVRDQREAIPKLALNFAFGALYAIAYAAALGRLRPPPLSGMAGAAYAGLFEMAVTYVLWLRALELSRTTAQVANLIFLAPFLSLVILHLVRGETIYLSSGAGLTLIVVGILVQRRTA